MQKFNTLQIFIRFALFGFIIVLLSFALSFWQLEKNVNENFFTESKLRLDDNLNLLEHQLKHYERTLLTMSSSSFIKESIEDESRQKLDYFYDVLASHKELLQLRFIDNEGNERFRINRDSTSNLPIVTPKDELQNRKDRYYFSTISNQAEGTVWYSNIDLYIEHGVIVRPFIPTLRLGVPIFIKGQRKGILIFNLSVYTLLQTLESHSHYRLYLIDSQGTFLVHPNSAYNWSKELDINYTLSDEFGTLAASIEENPSFTSHELFTKRFSLSNEVHYVFIARLNKKYLHDAQQELIIRFLIIALIVLLLTFPFSYFVAHHTTTLYLRLLAIVNSLGHGVFILNKNNKLTYINDNALNVLGFTKKDLMHNNFHDIVVHSLEDGTYIPYKDCPIQNIQQSSSSVTSDRHIFTTKQGRMINVEFTTTPLTIRGRFEGSITAFQDITSRKLLEQDLIDATTKLRMERNLFLVGPVVVFTWKNEASWPVEYVSSNVTTLFGHAKHEFTSQAIQYSDCIHPADIAQVTQEVEHALEKSLEHFTHRPYRIIHKDGSIHWVDDRTTIVRDATGDVTHLHGFLLDITQEKILEDQLNTSEKKYRKLVENASAGVFKCTQAFEFTYVNHAILDIFGFTHEKEFYESAIEEFFLYKNDAKQLIVALKHDGFVKSYRLVLRTPKGLIKHILLNAQLEDEVISGMVIDITEIAKAQEEVKKLSTVIDQIDDLVTITDVNGKIIYANEAMSKFSGYSKKELLGSNPRLYKSSHHTFEEIKRLWETILSKQVFRGVIINKKKDGTLFYEEKTITPLLNNKGEITSFVSTAKDITERVHMQHELERLATTDHLTQLYNRLKFEELFENELKNVKRYGRHMSLIMLDIDFFKKINDTYGHNVGDSVLGELSALLTREIRSTDKVARWGGEEFMILTPETDVTAALSLAEKLCQKIAAFEFTTVKHLTSSFGVTQLKEDEDYHCVTHRVDLALYQAKAEGRNRVISL